MRGRLTATLIGINLAAVLSAAWLVGSALSEPPLPRAEQDPADAAPASSAIFASISGDALSSHPLFTPSRRPLSDSEQKIMQIPPPAPPRLVGIVEEGPRVRRALLETATGDSRRLLRAGQVFEGWVVTEIHRNAITLTQPSPPNTSNAGSDLSLMLHPVGQPAGRPQ